MLKPAKIVFKYKLNENCVGETKGFGKQIISRKGTFYNEFQQELWPFVRTKDNPKGEIDYEEIDTNTQGILHSSYVNFKKRFPKYELKTLASMTRSQITDICLAYSIVSINRSTEFLINLILEKQDLYAVQAEQIKQKNEDKRLEEIVDKKIRQILEEKFVNLTDEGKDYLKKEVMESLKDEIKS